MKTTPLKTWQMMPLGSFDLRGAAVSDPNFDAAGWHPVEIPTTLVGGLHQAGAIADPYFGRVIAELPGYKDVPNHHVNVPKPTDSPFGRAWWFRTTFILPAGAPGQVLRLRLRGVNPAANVWLNGQRVASASYVNGTYSDFELPIVHAVRWNGENTLAVEVLPVEPDDLAITFIDWNPMPPDDCAGIWRPIEFRVTGPVALCHSWVQTDVADDLSTAVLRPQVTVRNDSPQRATAAVTFTCESIRLITEVEVDGHEETVVVFDPADWPELHVNSPRLWWPYQLGLPQRYLAEFSVAVVDPIPVGSERGVHLSDSIQTRFGIRRLEAPVNEYGAREFRVNGRPVPINAAAWTPDMLLREDANRDQLDLSYVKNMNLNTVRLEGKLASELFWELCDREGVLVLAGWPCCNHFEHWDRWKPGDLDVAVASLRSQLRRLRPHPSLIAWFYGSDDPPPPHVERAYLAVLDAETPGLPRLSSATATPTPGGGATGVKMTGPYDYVPPHYWYDRTMPGAAAGMNTETCPACALPMIDSIRRMAADSVQTDSRGPGGDSAGEIVPDDSVWRFHCAGAPFSTTRLLEEAISSRFGTPKDLDELVQWSQLLGYETWRAMYEAFRHNFPQATGVVGWMLNSSWPSLLWQLYDYWYHPTASFYATQSACRPEHAYLALDTRTVYARNDGAASVVSMRVSIECFTPTGERLWTTTDECSLVAAARERLFALPEAVCSEPLVLCYLTSMRVDSSSVAAAAVRSVYLLTHPTDRLEPADRSDWYYTPVTSHADLTALRTMPRARVSAMGTLRSTVARGSIQETSDATFPSGSHRLMVTVENVSEYPTLPLFLRVLDAETGDYVAAVYWDQNFVGLLPGEQITMNAHFDARDEDCHLIELSGLSIETVTIRVSPEHMTT